MNDSIWIVMEDQEIRSSLQYANTLLKSHQFENAFDIARNNHIQALEMGLKPENAKSLMIMAMARFHMGLDAGENARNSLYAQSHEYFLESLEIFERLHANEDASEVSFQIGRLYRQWGNFHEKAIHYFKRSLSLIPVENDEARITVLNMLVDSYISLNDHNSAIAFLNQVLKIHVSQKDPRAELDTRRLISEQYHELSQYENALKEELRILELKNELKDSVGIVNSYNNLGYIHKYLSQNEEALKYFEKSLSLTRHYNQSEQPTLMEKTVLMNIGVIYEEMGDNKKSIMKFYEALSIWLLKGQPEEIAKIYKKIGQNFIEIGDLEKARNHFRQALNVSKDSEDKQFIASLNKELSEIYQIMGDDKNALLCYQQYAKANDEYLSEQNKRQELLLQQQYKITLAETDKRLAIAEKVIGEIELEKKENENNLLIQERELLRKKEELQEAMLVNEQTEKIKTQQELKIIEQQYELVADSVLHHCTRR